MKHKKTDFGLAVAIIVIVAFTAAICLSAVACPAKKINFKAVFYVIYYSGAENEISVSALSETVESYGGAGYVLEYSDGFYVTVACYSDEQSAESVQAALKRRNLGCEILKAERTKYATKDRKNAERYAGNLNTLVSLADMAYNCANSLDTGEFGQSKAKEIISAIKSGTEAIKNSEAGNPFSVCAETVSDICDEIKKGYIYSRELRFLQVAIADAILNIDL